MKQAIVAPRIYCIPAADTPVAAVLMRGPSKWSHLGRWHLEDGSYEPGAWLGGRIFPRRSDLSPDGQYLCYFAHKPSATWDYGEAYIALSKLPWLTALHAFRTCGTWTRGYCFTEKKRIKNPNAEKLPIKYGLIPIQLVQFANERRRGWKETADCPPRRSGDFWDERRNARLQKRQPGGNRLLCVESLGRAGGEFATALAVDGLAVRYWLETDDDIELLEALQWADWDAKGRLLAATRSGRLQIWNLDADRSAPLYETDLAGLKPNPVPSPKWAQHW